MNMPTKAIAALVNIKASLLSPKPSQSVMITPEPPRKERKTTQRIRHAKRPNAYQRMMQRGDKW